MEMDAVVYLLGIAMESVDVMWMITYSTGWMGG